MNIDTTARSSQEQAFRACRQGDMETLVTLIEREPKLLHVRDNLGGQQLLHWAALQGHKAIAERLIELGAEVDARNPTRETPLLLTAMKGHLAVANVLLYHQADINAISGTDAVNIHVEGAPILNDVSDLIQMAPQTPLDRATAFGHKQMEQLLLSHGGKRNNPPDPPVLEEGVYRSPTSFPRLVSSALAILAVLLLFGSPYQLYQREPIGSFMLIGGIIFGLLYIVLRLLDKQHR